MPPSKKPFRPLVFIVDDEPDILRLVQLCLKSLPIRTEIFESGVDLLGRLKRKQRPNLFIFDVMMPGLSGYDLCRMIREKDDCSRIPVAFLTAKTSERDYLEGMQAGGNYYLEKPFDVDKLPEKVLAILAGQSKA